MITRLELKNFTTFNSLDIDFSPKINVIIGENGTGKTHLLKAAYGLCAGGSLFKNKPDTDAKEIESVLTAKLLRLFMPLDDKLGKMRSHGVNDYAQLTANFIFDKKISVGFHMSSKTLTIQENENYARYSWEPVFIPTKEVLSFMKGFNSLYEKYELSFDQTYQDICLLLDLPEARPETLHEVICGGRFIFYGGGKVTFKSESAEYSANSMAEGFRKIGILSRLLETGAIRPGVSGPLFWDEPESNMNPKLMKLLVQIMLELSRNGQQIILATHDYFLLKWFDLLMDKGKDDHVRFHALYRSAESGKVRIDSVDDYRAISPNAVADTFNDLTKEQVNQKMGSLGK
jgi:AAA15 family ATPase/GTPase